MKEMTTKELRECQLGILSEVHEFCKKNNIKYSLAYGTLLGAVRHKGYIPWDDDIDIMMLREDYDVFLSKFKNDRYIQICNETDKTYCHPFAKIYDKKTLIVENINQEAKIGVNIDVFPIDNFPNSFHKSVVFLRKKRLLSIIYILKNTKITSNRNIIKNIILAISQVILSPLSLNYLTKKIVEFSKQYNQEKTQYKGIVTVIDTNINERMSSVTYESTTLIDFENRKYLSFRDYDTILTAWYGDYLKLPPEDKQVTHHAFKAYWL